MRAPRGKHKFQSLSSIAGTKYGNRDQGICLVTVYFSLFLRHEAAEAFITLAATAPLLLADGEEWTPSNTEKEVILKTGAVEQSAESPPWFPGTGT